MSHNGPDRRRHARHAGSDRIRVHCRRRSGDESGVDLGLALIDISQSGLGVYLREPVEPGDVLEITLEAEGLFEPLRGVGVVRWSVEREDRTCTAGIELDNPLGEPDFDILCGGEIPPTSWLN